MINKKILDNGLKILHKKTNTESISIEVCVKAGCIYEPDELMGISHFLEHMLFNGTTNRTQLEILSAIENLGGEVNAATSSDRTFYYIKILKKHFDTALEIISDMVLNSNFPEELFKREKGIVLDEINMVYDTPRHYQFVLFQESLYKNHPLSKRVLGTKETITNLSREQLMDYYKNMYVPNNMILSVVGDVENVFEKVEEKFKEEESKEIIFKKIEPQENKKRSLVEKRDMSQSYLIIGYTIPKKK